MHAEQVENLEQMKQAESVDGIKWEFGITKDPPSNIFNHGSTHLKEESNYLFQTPVLSLLNFLPIGIWIVIVNESNKYAHSLMESQLNSKHTIPGNDIDIIELMTFYVIMLHMCLRPIPGNTIEIWTLCQYAYITFYTTRVTVGSATATYLLHTTVTLLSTRIMHPTRIATTGILE